MQDASATPPRFTPTSHDKRRNYQAAFKLWQLRLFDEWNEDAWRGGEFEYQSDQLQDMDIVYLQDNYVVMRGTYINRELNVVWPESKVTEKWKLFCQQQLKFEIPEWTQKERNTRVYSREEKEEMR